MAASDWYKQKTNQTIDSLVKQFRATGLFL